MWIINWIKEKLRPELPNTYWIRAIDKKYPNYSVCLDTRNKDGYGCLHRFEYGKWISYKKLTLEELYFLQTIPYLLTPDMVKTINSLFKSGLGYGYIYNMEQDE